MLNNLQPVKVKARKGGREPEPEQGRSLSEALDDTVSKLSESWRRHARHLVDDVLRDLDSDRPQATDMSYEAYSKVTGTLTALRDEIVNGGLKGARQAFNALSTLKGYRESPASEKQVMISRFIGHHMPA